MLGFEPIAGEQWTDGDNPNFLFVALERAGFTIRHDGAGSLIVSPSSKLTPEQRDAVKRHKKHLLSILSVRCEDALTDAAMIRRYATGPA